MKTVIASLVVFIGLIEVAADAGGFNYADALDKTLMFFEAQRSGKLPSDQRVTWRGDSGLHDGIPQGVNLVGGYYDAGDHVKFGLPMAFTMTILSWGVIEFRKEITDLNQMAYTLSAIKWGTDYLIKAHSQPNVLWGQVGDGDSDHSCWERAEDMATPRTAYKIDSNNPGSDLAGETAAALAAASVAFRPYNSAYSDLLLAHAKQLFTFADRFRGTYDKSIPSASNFYASSGYKDELLWGATWLYRATADKYYLNYVVNNAASMGGTGWAVQEFSWDNKYAGVQILLSKLSMEGNQGIYSAVLKQYQAKAEYFVCACIQKNDGYNVPTTPGGLLHLHEWNNLQYVSSAAFLLAVYSEYLSASKSKLKCPDGQVQSADVLSFAESQADYILGKNPKSTSYIVGYGTNYPTNVHHRGASITSINVLSSAVDCAQGFEEWYSRHQPNPNVIHGALVGGPDNKDGFSNDRSNYEETEPTISGTAPLVGLFSKLQSTNNGATTGNYNEKLSTRPKRSLPVAGNSTEKPPVHPQVSPVTNSDVPVQFLHSITKTWTTGGTTYYRHKVTIKNASNTPITELNLQIANLSGSLWGLTPAGTKDTFQLPSWVKGLNPGSHYSFVYIQDGQSAKISIISYQ